MAIDRDEFRDLTRNFLEGFIEDTDASTLNEQTSEPIAKSEKLVASFNDPRQLTFNQDEVNQVEAMRKALDKMYFEYQKIKSVPPAWLDDGDSFGEDRYSKLESLLFDASEELSDLAHDMKKARI